MARTKTVQNSRPQFDRVPPQSIEAERSVLGAMLLNPEAVGAATEILQQNPMDIFYVEAHQHVYSAVMALSAKGTPADIVTVFQQLQDDGQAEAVGGASYLSDLLSAVPTSANVEYYARIVLDAALRRKLISSCGHLSSLAYEGEGDVKEILDQAESAIFSLSQVRQVNPIRKVGDLVDHAVQQIEKLYKSHSGLTGLPTGFTELDRMLGGLQPSDMIVLAARPSVGKTAFALNIAARAAIEDKKGVLVFSLEMSQEQLTHRLLCMEGGIDIQRLRDGYMAGKEIAKLPHAATRVYSAPIFIDDTANISMLEIRSKARRQMSQHPISLIIIDYLQLMGGSRRAENRQVEISEISRGVKGLARELRIPVIALSQLSREAEKDDTGRPKLSHLRESGSIEQDADVVMMLFREQIHKRPGGDEEQGTRDDPRIKLSIAKQRNGPTGEIDLLFFRNVQKFGNPEKSVRGATGYQEVEPIDDQDDTPF